jgi:hypothetical protein
MTARIIHTIGAQMDQNELDAAFKQVYQAQENRQNFTGKRARKAYERLVLSLRDPLSTPLPAIPYKNRREYNALLAREQAKADDQRSRQEIADAIGISRAQVTNLLQDAGIENEAQFVQAEVQAGGDLGVKIQQQARRVRGWPKSAVIASEGRLEAVAYHPDTTPQQLKAAIAQGATVEIVYQVASKQHIVRDEPLPPPRTRPERELTRAEIRQMEQGKLPGPSKPRKPRKPRYFGPGYDPDWVRDHLILSLLLTGWEWVGEDRLVNGRTGEMIRADLPAISLLEIVVGRPVATGDAERDAMRHVVF